MYILIFNAGYMLNDAFSLLLFYVGWFETMPFSFIAFFDRNATGYRRFPDSGVPDSGLHVSGFPFAS